MTHLRRLHRFLATVLPTDPPTLLLACMLAAASLLPGEGRDGWIVAADARAANREQAAALALYEAAGQSSPYGGGLDVRIARVHLAKGRLAMAETRLAGAAEQCAAAATSPLATALPLSVCTAEVRLAQGLTYARLGRPDEAAVALQEARAAGLSEAAYPLAMALLRTGDTGSARAILNSLPAGRPPAALPMALLTALDDPNAAIPLLAAASTGPRSEQALLAWALSSPATAGSEIDRAMLVGRAALRSGQLEVALAAFSRALAADPGWAQPLAHRAYAHYQLGEDSLALEDAAAALHLDAKEATAHHVQGLVLLRRGDAASARDALEAALAADPSNAAILCDLAAAYAELHAYDQAQSDLVAAVQMDPASPVPLMRLARFHLSSLLHVDAGLSAAREAARLEPGSAEAIHLVGWGLYLTGKPGEALATLEQSIALDPLAPEAHFHLGQALQALGRTAQATSAYRRASDLDTTGVLEARAETALAGLR